jgi:hypothetical protein
MDTDRRMKREPAAGGGWAAAALGVIFFGSLWGALEATVGAALHLTHFPYKGAIMANVGFFVMAAAARRSHPRVEGQPPRRRFHAGSPERQLPFIGLVAALFKVMDAFILGVPVWDRMVLNPAIAIIAEALCFTLVLIPFRRAAAGAYAEARAGAGPVDAARFTSAGAVTSRSAVLAEATVMAAGAAGAFLSNALASSLYFYILRAGPAQAAAQGDLVRFVALHGGVAALLALPSCAAGSLVGARTWALPRIALPFLAAAFWGIGALARVAPVLHVM